jgi:putative membrane protein
MLRSLLRWLLNAAALTIVPELISSIQVHDLTTALVAAIIISLLNAIIRPVLVILTLPITFLSLGIFYLVINALLFWLAASLVPGFEIGGFWAAMAGAIVYSVLTWFVDLAVGKGKTH